MASGAVTSILVIEDDPIDFKFLEITLRSHNEFQLYCAGTAAEAQSTLEKDVYDLVLVDLTLPDSDGLQTVSMVLDLTNSPVVVLSGVDDEQIALDAVKLGAQDYLVKGHFNSVLLTRTLKYAIERCRLLYELSVTKQQMREERDRRSLQVAIDVNPTPTDLLQQRYPDAFKHAVDQYRQLLLHEVNQRIYKGEFDSSEPLKQLAMQLGSRQTMASDVIDMHNKTLRCLLESVNQDMAHVYSEEARYLLTGLFGHLCSYYQRNNTAQGDPAALVPVVEKAPSSAVFPI